MEGDADFDDAVYFIANYVDPTFVPSDSLKLQFYGLYKQATAGPCTGPRPGFFDVVARAKYDAWAAHGKKSRATAAEDYVALLTSKYAPWREWSGLQRRHAASRVQVQSDASSQSSMARASSHTPSALAAVAAEVESAGARVPAAATPVPALQTPSTARRRHASAAPASAISVGSTGSAIYEDFTATARRPAGRGGPAAATNSGGSNSGSGGAGSSSWLRSAWGYLSPWQQPRQRPLSLLPEGTGEEGEGEEEGENKNEEEAAADQFQQQLQYAEEVLATAAHRARQRSSVGSINGGLRVAGGSPLTASSLPWPGASPPAASAASAASAAAAAAAATGANYSRDSTGTPFPSIPAAQLQPADGSSPAPAPVPIGVPLSAHRLQRRLTIEDAAAILQAKLSRPQLGRLCAELQATVVEQEAALVESAQVLQGLQQLQLQQLQQRRARASLNGTGNGSGDGGSRQSLGPAAAAADVVGAAAATPTVAATPGRRPASTAATPSRSSPAATTAPAPAAARRRPLSLLLWLYDWLLPAAAGGAGGTRPVGLAQLYRVLRLVALLLSVLLLVWKGGRLMLPGLIAPRRLHN